MSSSADRHAPATTLGPCLALLDGIAAGDRSALAGLYDRVAPAVHLLARRRCATDVAAEHVVQEAFLQIWRSAPRFRPQERTAEGWIMDAIADALSRTLPVSNTSIIDS